MATDSTRDDRIGNHRAIRATSSPSPLLEGRVLVVVDRPAGWTGNLGIGDPHTRITGRPRPPNRVTSGITATHDRLIAIIRLIQNCDKGASVYGRSDPNASVVYDVGIRRARRKEPSNHAVVLVDPMLYWMKAVILAKVGTGPARRNVVRDYDRAVVLPHHTDA